MADPRPFREIRYLFTEFEHSAWRLETQGGYAWLFDSRVVMKFHFGEDQETLGAELIEEPADVLHACQVRDLAWHYVVPTARFQEQVPSPG